jgi:hypothetical protein
VMAKDVTGIDATAADSGTVTLTLDGGKTVAAKVLTAQPGFLLVQVEGDKGAMSQLNIGQLGKGGPLVLSDGLASVQFSAKE